MPIQNAQNAVFIRAQIVVAALEAWHAEADRSGDKTTESTSQTARAIRDATGWIADDIKAMRHCAASFWEAVDLETRDR